MEDPSDYSSKEFESTDFWNQAHDSLTEDNRKFCKEKALHFAPQDELHLKFRSEQELFNLADLMRSSLSRVGIKNTRVNFVDAKPTVLGSQSKLNEDQLTSMMTELVHEKINQSGVWDKELIVEWDKENIEKRETALYDF